jgi:hypothetical protein
VGSTPTGGTNMFSRELKKAAEELAQLIHPHGIANIPTWFTSIGLSKKEDEEILVVYASDVKAAGKFLMNYLDMNSSFYGFRVRIHLAGKIKLL